MRSDDDLMTLLQHQAQWQYVLRVTIGCYVYISDFLHSLGALSWSQLPASHTTTHMGG